MSDTINRDPEAAAEWMNEAIEAAKRLKISSVEVGKKHNVNDPFKIPVMLTGYREGDAVVSVVADRMGDDISLVCGLMLGGARCDQITSVSEGLSSHTEVNPETGETWEDRDMQFLLETNPALAAEAGVHTCLFLHLIHRPEHPFSHTDDRPHYTCVIPYVQTAEGITFELDEGITVRTWGHEDDPTAISGVEFFLTQNTMHEQIRQDIESGNIPLDLENYLAMNEEFGVDLIVDVNTVKQLNMLDDVRAAGLMFSEKDTPRYEIFQRIIGGEVDLDPFEALGIKSEDGWKVKRIQFSEGEAVDLDG